MSFKTLGVGLGKFSCRVIGKDQHGKVVEKRKIRISKSAEYLANLPPKQHSTGGISNLLGISKPGNSTLRKYLINGARSAIQWKLEENHACTPWIKKLLCGKKKTVAVVAMANKLARIIWAVLTKERSYAAVAA